MFKKLAMGVAEMPLFFILSRHRCYFDSQGKPELEVEKQAEQRGNVPFHACAQGWAPVQTPPGVATFSFMNFSLLSFPVPDHLIRDDWNLQLSRH